MRTRRFDSTRSTQDMGLSGARTRACREFSRAPTGNMSINRIGIAASSIAQTRLGVWIAPRILLLQAFFSLTCRAAKLCCS